MYLILIRPVIWYITMVQRLINAINALQHNQKQTTIGKDNKEKVLQSTLSILGRHLKLSFQNTLSKNKKSSSKKKNVSTPQVGSSSSLSSQSQQQSLRIPTNSSSGSTTTTTTNAWSPPRRRKGSQLSTSNDTNLSSPRKGDRSKFIRMSSTSTSVDFDSGLSVSGGLDTTSTIQSQLSYTTSSNNDISYMTTEFLGWRRLHLEEIVRLDVGQPFILIIPSNKQRGENKHLQEQRDNLRLRMVSTLIESCSKEYKDVTSALQRKKKANEQLESQNGIKRNGATYIELKCIVVNYPHKDEYRDEIYTVSEVERHVDQFGGFNIRLLDYPCNDSMLIKWSEVNTVQLYVESYRGDPRPQISLSKRSHDYLYCDELTDKLNIVQDDVIQMLELKLEFEKHKTTILNTKLSKATKKLNAISMTVDEQHEQTQQNHLQEYQTALEDELADTRIQNFALETDRLYEDAWHGHYKNFQPNTRLLSESVADRIFNLIREQFPLHFLVLQSLIFPKRAHQPARRVTQGYKDKKKALSNHFCSLVRVRNPSYLIHWAMVGTLAMWGKGMQLKLYRNPVLKAFSAGIVTTFKYLDKIYDDTRQVRVAVMQSKQYVSHASDNYQQWHPFSLQRDNTAGLMHNGMVFNLVMAREYLKPKGTIYLDPGGKKWEVLSSEMPDYWTCVVTLRICAGQEVVTEQDERTLGYERSTMDVQMPQMGWNIESLPNVTPRPSITYINQEIPSSIRMNVPSNVSDCHLLTRQGYEITEETTDIETLSPRKYVSLIRAQRRLQEILQYCQQTAKLVTEPVNGLSDTLAGDVLDTIFASLNTILKRTPSIRNNVYSFQKDNLKEWNQAYVAVDKFIWLPICPREEMATDQALLAMVHIFEELGMIVKQDNGEYALGDTTPQRMIFQYGDVLTIKKWHNLKYYILKKYTTIGKEEYVSIMMETYKRFVKIQDYLHENIHRLQVIFKLFYGGFIQPIQALLGTKKVKFDPTKGSWKEHEHLTKKIYFALQRIRLEEFLTLHGLTTISDMDLDDEDVFWNLQLKYKEYSENLEKSVCMKTRVVALFMKYVEDWLMCVDGVKVSDWALLEVLGCDWITMWSAVGKPQYLLEAKRRMEQMYGELTPQDLEYLRMNRFFRMSEGGNTIAHDDCCEKHNLAQKQCPKNSNFETVVKRSKHLHAASRAGKEMFGERTSKSSIPNRKRDVDQIYAFLRKVNVIKLADTECRVSDNTFWEHVVAPAKKSANKQRHVDKKDVALTDHDVKVLEVFMDRPTIEAPNNEQIFDDLSVTSVQTNHSRRSVTSVDSAIAADALAAEMDDMMVQLADDTIDTQVDEQEKPLSTVKLQEKALKKLGNVRRYKLDRKCIDDQFDIGREKLKNIVVERGKQIAIEERKLELIYDAVAHYKTKMAAVLVELDEVMNRTTRRELQPWESTILAARKQFDEAAYMRRR